MRITKLGLLILFTVILCNLSACVTPHAPKVQSDKIMIDSDYRCARKLDGKYTIKNKSGLFKENPTWKPIKVYNDGASVYIKMPPGVHIKPTLYILDDKKHPWELHYQVNKHYYRIDYLFKKALLVQDDEKIEITQK